MVTAALVESSSSAVVGKIDLELHLALGQRPFSCEREVVQDEEIVDKRRLAVSDVQAVAAD
jgi:hypothetical protein